MVGGLCIVRKNVIGSYLVQMFIADRKCQKSKSYKFDANKTKSICFLFLRKYQQNLQTMLISAIEFKERKTKKNQNQSNLQKQVNMKIKYLLIFKEIPWKSSTIIIHVAAAMFRLCDCSLLRLLAVLCSLLYGMGKVIVCSCNIYFKTETMSLL